MPGQLLCACARDIGWLVAMDLCGVLHARPLTAHRTWSLWQDPKLAWIRNFVESVNANSNTWVYPAEISAIVSFPLHSGQTVCYLRDFSPKLQFTLVDPTVIIALHILFIWWFARIAHSRLGLLIRYGLLI